jgi:hypothetical protein
VPRSLYVLLLMLAFTSGTIAQSAELLDVNQDLVFSALVRLMDSSDVGFVDLLQSSANLDSQSQEIAPLVPGFKCTLSRDGVHDLTRTGFHECTCTAKLFVGQSDAVFQKLATNIKERFGGPGGWFPLEGLPSLEKAASISDNILALHRTAYDPLFTISYRFQTLDFSVSLGPRKFDATLMKPKDDFERTLYQILQYRDDHYKQIKGEPNLRTVSNSWHTTLSLPGYDECDVVEPSDDQSSYECYAKANGDAEAIQRVFETSVSRLHGALPGWDLSQKSTATTKTVCLINYANGFLTMPVEIAKSSDGIRISMAVFGWPGRRPDFLGTPRTGKTIGSAASAIDEIRRGAYSPLPPARGVANLGASSTTLRVKNGTAYMLTLYLSGPMDQTITLTPGGSQQIALVGGQYRLAAKVSDPSVLPFYGEQSFGGGDYSEDFYIGAR